MSDPVWFWFLDAFFPNTVDMQRQFVAQMTSVSESPYADAFT